MIGARHRHLAVLHRLAERIQHPRIEFRQFVEKQHALVRQRNLARPGAGAAAGQRGHAGGMVRCAERPAVGQRAVLDRAGHRGDHRDVEQFRRRQRWQDRGQARRQHRFAGAGRTGHQQVVAAGGRDLQRALGALLALEVTQVEEIGRRAVHAWLRSRQHLRSLEMIGDLDQRLRRDDLDVGTGPGRFGAAGGGADQAFVAGIGRDRGGKHPGDRRQRAVEPEFAEHGEADSASDGIARSPPSGGAIDGS